MLTNDQLDGMNLRAVMGDDILLISAIGQVTFLNSSIYLSAEQLQTTLNLTNEFTSWVDTLKMSSKPVFSSNVIRHVKTLTLQLYIDGSRVDMQSGIGNLIELNLNGTLSPAIMRGIADLADKFAIWAVISDSEE